MGSVGLTLRPKASRCSPWLRTNGVNTNGVAAEVMNFDRLGKHVQYAQLTDFGRFYRLVPQ